jgi:hypothetical protein
MRWNTQNAFLGKVGVPKLSFYRRVWRGKVSNYHFTNSGQAAIKASSSEMHFGRLCNRINKFCSRWPQERRVFTPVIVWEMFSNRLLVLINIANEHITFFGRQITHMLLRDFFLICLVFGSRYLDRSLGCFYFFETIRAIVLKEKKI